MNNRRYFYEAARAELARFCRHGSAVSVIMLDIDHFKKVNDTYGHTVGDQVLRHVAGQLRAQLRNVDILARYGGEEFIILLPETNGELACQVAERLRLCTATTPLSHEAATIPITISLGIASETSEAPQDLEQLLNHADEALYVAKQAGRNRASIWKLESDRADVLEG